MATQSLYRRYRPRRFSEVKGQDHVVRALRNSVAEGREGQAYLFSGPRGTGKTTSARILAKVLNCTDPRDGEPCCECESCLSVERGTSYDVHELDAASNNGVDSMRDLIEKASLGTPGRHKVYILDEVHMLSRGAEAALLKTLEEPPPHVVFVLATTDPQKMSDTIRSRTQHLQFHLLPADTLQEHVRWVAEDAGLEVSDAAIEHVLMQGAGSARDTLSALELVASTGGEGAETVPLNEFVEAMIDRDPGGALTMVAGAIGLGRDPRTLTEELIGFLRNGFLSIMAPDLVQLQSQRVASLSDLAQRLGAAGLVRGIEQLGEALTEMRHAPDPRVLLDVAVVRLTSDDVAPGGGASDGAAAGPALAALTKRIAKLEQQIADGVPLAASAQTTAPTSASTTAPTSAPTSAPGSASASASTRSVASDATAVEGAAPASATDSAPVNPDTGRAALGGRARRGAPAAPTASASTTSTSGSSARRSDAADRAQVDGGPSIKQAADAVDTPGVAASPATQIDQSLWNDTVKPGLSGMTRAVFSPATYVAHTSSTLTLSLPNPVHREKCEQHRDAVEQALLAASGAPITLELVLGDGAADDSGAAGNDGGGNEGGGNQGGGNDGGGNDGGGNEGGRSDRGSASGGGGAGGSPAPEGGSGGARPTDPDPSGTGESGVRPADRTRVGSEAASDVVHSDNDEPSAAFGVVGDEAAPESPRRAAQRKLAEAAATGRSAQDADADAEFATEAEIYVLPEDHEVDVTDLVDAPPETVKTPIDRLAEAFPGSEFVQETQL